VTDRAPERAALLATALVAAAVAVLAATSRRSGRETDGAREFHSLVGGLGGGSATSLAICEAAFDPTADAVCARAGEPIPGGAAFCPHHGGPSPRR
jgi:hypothetical protein